MALYGVDQLAAIAATAWHFCGGLGPDTGTSYDLVLAACKTLGQHAMTL